MQEKIRNLSSLLDAMSGDARAPYVIGILIQVVYASAYVVTKASLNHGMNSFVFTFYRQAAGMLLLLPIALVFQRKNLPSLSPRLLLKLFLCALIGNTTCINLVHLSMALTSATVASATANSVPVLTFFFALLFRMEVLKVRSFSGIAKLAGIGLCVAGVFVMSFYDGPALSPVNHHHAFAHTMITKNSPSRATWITGTFLMVLATILWSIWLVMQTGVLKEFPNKMLVTVTQCVFSVVQCLLVAVVAERDFSKWKLGFNVGLLAVLYNGVMVTGVCYYLQTWCMEKKGPVFLAIWTPLLFIITIFCSSFFLGEIVHLGSIIGGVLLVGGLYSVLWGKTREPTITERGDVNSADDIHDGKDDHKIPQEVLEKSESRDEQV